MSKSIIFLSLVFISLNPQLRAQKIIEKYDQKTDSIRIAKDEYLSYFEEGYTLLLPETKEIRGTLVSLEDRRFNLDQRNEPGSISTIATKRGFAVLYISTGVPVDIFFSESSMQYVDRTLQTVFKRHKIANQNIFLFGNMVAGHRALKYVAYCEKERSDLNPNIRGIVISESPIDWVRMWYEGQKQVRDSLTSIKHFEGNLISALFEDAFGVTPVEDLQKYVDFSPYTYFENTTAKQQLFAHYAIRAYTFAPTNYWFSTNGNGVNDCNFPDMCGFINEQKLLGNEDAELIVFTNEKRETVSAMEVQSNTWNLADKKELMDWIESKIMQ